MTIIARRKETLTRTEMLRRRRGQSSSAPRLRSAVAYPRTVWEPRPRRTTARAHRHIRLEEPGVEVQLPAISVSCPPRALAVIVAGLAAGALLFLLTAPTFRAGQPAVEGNHYVSADAVVNAADVQGINFLLLSPADVRAEILRRIPGIRGVNVVVEPSGAVRLEIEERAPILLWSQAGKEYWADADGVIYPVTKPVEGLVRVDVRDQGPEIMIDGEADVDPRVVINALEMAVSLPVGSRIVYDTTHGLGMLDTGGMAVYFGSSGQIEQKMEIYRRLAQRFAATGTRPSLVDVADIWQPFYLR
jgi:cell division septal protein FtsQ